MSEEKKTELPKGADFTLKVPLNREKTSFATFHLKDITEDVYLAAIAMSEKDKDLDGVRMAVKALWVGGDNPDLLSTNLIATLSARKALKELMQVIDGDLKKN